LLEIRNAEQASNHFLRGGLFKNLVINEFIKNSLNKGYEPQVSFWRDKNLKTSQGNVIPWQELSLL